MSFEDEEEEEHKRSSSPKGSVSSKSSFIFFDESQLEDEVDLFEDAQDGGPATKVEEQMKTLSEQLICDCDEERIALPILRNPKITASTMWTILKDMVGKDITKYSMPVILNEPLSAL